MRRHQQHQHLQLIRSIYSRIQFGHEVRPLKGCRRSYHHPNYPLYSTTAATATTTYNHVNDKFLLRGTLRPGDGIAVSQYAELHRTFTPQEVQTYGDIIGDHNPIHSIHPSTPAYTDAHAHVEDSNNGHKRTTPGKIVVHGILTASLFSAIFGTLIPGSIYRSQSMRFSSPVYCDEPVVGRIVVTGVRNMRRRGALVACRTSVLRYGGRGLGGVDIDVGGVCEGDNMEECVVGEAEVWLPSIRGKEG